VRPGANSIAWIRESRIGRRYFPRREGVCDRALAAAVFAAFEAVLLLSVLLAALAALAPVCLLFLAMITSSRQPVAPGW
jgi:hypothetical protein